MNTCCFIVLAKVGVCTYFHQFVCVIIFVRVKLHTCTVQSENKLKQLIQLFVHYQILKEEELYCSRLSKNRSLDIGQYVRHRCAQNSENSREKMRTYGVVLTNHEEVSEWRTENPLARILKIKYVALYHKWLLKISSYNKTFCDSSKVPLLKCPSSVTLL